MVKDSSAEGAYAILLRDALRELNEEWSHEVRPDGSVESAGE
jgi:hypothetical protein